MSRVRNQLQTRINEYLIGKSDDATGLLANGRYLAPISVVIISVASVLLLQHMHMMSKTINFNIATIKFVIWNSKQLNFNIQEKLLLAPREVREIYGSKFTCNENFISALRSNAF